jgi:CDP-glycerol glycerophosphotransferase (TagB/SpsB family)
VHGAIYTPTKFVPLKADYVFTWGRNHNVFFTNLQERKNKYLKVGNPRFKNVLLKKQVVLDKYGIDTSKKIILHPSQNFPDLNDFEVIEKLVKCIAATKEFILAVKFHPSQNNKSLISKIESLKGIIILDESMSVTECLSISDITLLVSSTFAIDSLVAQIPVIVYSPDRTLRGIACELVGVGKCLQYSDFNLGELSSLLNDKGYNEKLNLSKQLLFIKNYCEFYNKQSAKLISDILQDEIH